MSAIPLDTLAYERTGSGEPLVLLHPLGADRGVWEPVLGLLAPHHDAIAMDMPGFGESPELPGDLAPTARAIGAVVAATLDSLGIGRAHVAGISLGGWVALEFAKTSRCLTVTGICPAGFWARPLGPRPETSRRAARALVPLLRPLLQSDRARRLILRGSIAHPERVPPAAAYRLVRSYASSPGFPRANAEMRRTVFEGLEDIHVPVTLAWAEHDRLVSPPARVPEGIQTERLAGCGHVPTWDDPARVAEVILTSTARAELSPGVLPA
ncbi:MAG: alpha/beta fold hydrolase [Actinomycetota bacterium]|nr:alpha/beta fold hydrolase [Actinomycetota bacterium]